MDKEQQAAMQSSLDDVYATLAEIREHLFAAQEAVWHENVEEGVESSRQAVAGALRACHKHKIGLQALTAQFPDALKAERSAEEAGGDRKPPVQAEQQQQAPTQRTGRAESAGSGPADKQRDDDLGRAASALEQSMISIDNVVRRGRQTRPAGQSPPPTPPQGEPQQQHVQQQHVQQQHQHQRHQHQHPGFGPAIYSSGGGGEGSGSRGALSASQSGGGGARAGEAVGSSNDMDARRRGGAATMEGQQHQHQHQQEHQAGIYPAPIAPHAAVMDRDIVYSQQDWQPAPNSARGNGQVSYSSLKSQEEYDYAAAIRNKINSLGPMAPLALPDRSHALSAPNSARKPGGAGSYSGSSQEPIHMALEHVLSEYQGRSVGGGGGPRVGGEGEEIVGGLMLVQHEIRPGMLTKNQQQDQQAHHSHQGQQHHSSSNNDNNYNYNYNNSSSSSSSNNNNPSLRYSFNGEASVVPVQQGYSYPHMSVGGVGRRAPGGGSAEPQQQPPIVGISTVPPHVGYGQGGAAGFNVGRRGSGSSQPAFGQSRVGSHQGGAYAGQQQVEAMSNGSAMYHQGGHQQTMLPRPGQFQPFRGQDAFGQGQVMRMGRASRNTTMMQTISSFQD